MSHATASEYLDKNTLREMARIPQSVLDQGMAMAYALYEDRRFAEAEVFCKGLLAADHRYWWSYSLYAAVLQKMGRFKEALVQLDRGLKYEPGQPKLLAMRTEILRRSALALDLANNSKARLAAAARAEVRQ